MDRPLSRHQVIVPVPKPAVHDVELERGGLEYKLQLSFDGSATPSVQHSHLASIGTPSCPNQCTRCPPVLLSLHL